MIHFLDNSSFLIIFFCFFIIILLGFYIIWQKKPKKNELFLENLHLLVNAQKDMEARLKGFYDLWQNNQNQLQNNLRSDLHVMNEALNQKLQVQSQNTQTTLGDLKTRLELIDRAQNNIQELSHNVMNLQKIFSNKQERGAFGQKNMEAIITDALPTKAYAFQATLSNKARPDCLIYMPNNAPALAIDAKFPLEAWVQYKESFDLEQKKIARAKFKKDIENHIQTIAIKYLIHGETQEVAFLFVPSEAIFATIHDEFEDLVQKAYHARIMIISPSLLLLSISVVQSIFKDAHMREQAHIIQKEIRLLLDDMARLDKRVANLNTYFNKAHETIRDISISSEKITKKGREIINFDLGSEEQKNLIEEKRERQN